MVDFKYSDITEKIIGGASRVHNTPGCGCQKVIYQRSLQLEFNLIPLEYKREFEMRGYYSDEQKGAGRVDFFVKNKISVERKALKIIHDTNLAKAINYSEGYNLEIGLLINFGSKRMEFHRFTNKKYNPGIIHHAIQSKKSQ